MGVHRRLLLFSAAWCAAGIAAASPAAAVRGHGFVRAFPSGSEPGLSLAAGSGARGSAANAASGVAVSAVSGDVLVADTGNRRVDEFSSSGSFIRGWGWGVANGAAELQVCSVGCKAGLSGSEPGEFETPTFVAVDNDSSSASYGDVYVGDVGDDLVSKFTAEGALVGSWGDNGENAGHERVEPNGQLNGEVSPERVPFGVGGSEPLAGVGVDGSGNLWVLDVNEKLFEFGQAGGFVARCFVSETVGPRGIAVGSVGVFAVETFGRVLRVGFGDCGGPVGLTSLARPASGLAFDGSSGDLYVDGAGELVEDLPAGCVASGSGCAASNVFGDGGEEGVLREGGGVAVDPSSGVVYVADVGAQQVFAYGVVVEADTAAASEVTAHSVTLHGFVNPDGTELSQCEFEYGTSEAYGSVAACEETPAEIGSGSGLVAVQAKVSGLFGGAGYHFRLRAASTKGDMRSEDEAFSTLATAQVVSVVAKEVGGTAALLEGEVDPEGLEATYHFEVGECSNLAACPGSGYPIVLASKSLASGSSGVPVSQRVEGLVAGRIYHFRLLAEDANGSSYPEQGGSMEGTFVYAPPNPSCGRHRLQPGSEGLPDCRGYELVTPAFKNGGFLESGSFLTAAAVAGDGSRVIATSIQCFDESPSCIGVRQTTGAPFAFERGPEGWVTRPLALPGSFTGSTIVTYRADSGMVLYAAPPSEGGVEQFYVRQLDGSLGSLGPLGEKPGFTAKGVIANKWMGTGDLSHFVYEREDLWGFDESTGGGVYEYPGVGGRPLLVDVTGVGRASTSLVSECGAALGGAKAIEDKVGVVSGDGRRVVFTAHPCSSGTGENVGVPVLAETLYQRVEKSGGLMETLLVSGRGGGGVCSSKACMGSPAGNAEFAGASVDGSRVFFLDTQQLTDGASEDSRKGDTAGGATCPLTASDASGCNLYLWVCPGLCEGGGGEGRLVDVSGGDVSGRGPQVQGVVAVAPDGSRVYFVARGVLAGVNAAGVSPSPGGDNLYVYGPDREGHDRVSFIATLTASDEGLWVNGVGVGNVSPDGRFLVFSSHRALTGDVARLEGPAQVYRYDADAGSANEVLLRVSVGEEGFGDNGNGGVGDARIAPAKYGLETGGRSDPTMSDDGRFVFFESPVGLTPGALNDVHVAGNPGVLAENVYEWEAFGAKPSEGSAACGQPGGCVWLISDGRDVHEGSFGHGNESAVELLGTDSSGQNVFFETADQLVAGDTDTQVDFYDARVDGGFPAKETLPACEDLVACRGLMTGEAPAAGGSGSGVFSGFGNFLAGSEEHAPTHGGRLSARQLLAAALAKCRHDHGRTRVVCVRRARAAYRARLLAAALASCRHDRGRVRVRCERAVRLRYGRRGR